MLQKSDIIDYHFVIQNAMQSNSSESILSTLSQLEISYDSNADNLSELQIYELTQCINFSFHYNEEVQTATMHFVKKIITSEQHLIETGQKQTSSVSSQKCFNTILDNFRNYIIQTQSDEMYILQEQVQDIITMYLNYALRQNVQLQESQLLYNLVTILLENKHFQQLILNILQINQNIILCNIKSNGQIDPLQTYVLMVIDLIITKNELQFKYVLNILLQIIQFIINLNGESSQQAQQNQQSIVLVLKQLLTFQQKQYSIVFAQLSHTQLIQFQQIVIRSLDVYFQLNQQDTSVIAFTLQLSNLTVFQYQSNSGEQINQQTLFQFLLNLLQKALQLQPSNIKQNMSHLVPIFNNILFGAQFSFNQQIIARQFTPKIFVLIINCAQQIKSIDQSADKLFQQLGIIKLIQGFIENLIKNFIQDLNYFSINQSQGLLPDITNAYLQYFELFAPQLQQLSSLVDIFTFEFLTQTILILYTSEDICNEYALYLINNAYKSQIISQIKFYESYQFYDIINNIISYIIVAAFESETTGKFFFTKHIVQQLHRQLNKDKSIKVQNKQLLNEFSLSGIETGITIQQSTNLLHLFEVILNKNEIVKQTITADEQQDLNQIIITLLYLSQFSDIKLIVNQLLISIFNKYSKFITTHFQDFLYQQVYNDIKFKLSIYNQKLNNYDLKNQKCAELMNFQFSQFQQFNDDCQQQNSQQFFSTVSEFRNYIQNFIGNKESKNQILKDEEKSQQFINSLKFGYQQLSLELICFCLFELEFFQQDDYINEIVICILKMAPLVWQGRNLVLKQYVFEQLNKLNYLTNYLFQKLNSINFNNYYVQDTQNFVYALKFQLMLANAQSEILTQQSIQLKQHTTRQVQQFTQQPPPNQQNGQQQYQQNQQIPSSQSLDSNQISISIQQHSLFYLYQFFVVLDIEFSNQQSSQILGVSNIDQLKMSCFINVANDLPETYQEFNYINILSVKPFQLQHIFLQNNHPLSPLSFANQSLIILGKCAILAEKIKPSDEITNFNNNNLKLNIEFIKMTKVEDQQVVLNFQQDEQPQIQFKTDISYESLQKSAVYFLSNQLLSQNINHVQYIEGLNKEIFEEKKLILKELKDLNNLIFNYLKINENKNSELISYTCLNIIFQYLSTYDTYVYDQLTELFQDQKQSKLQLNIILSLFNISLYQFDDAYINYYQTVCNEAAFLLSTLLKECTKETFENIQTSIQQLYFEKLNNKIVLSRFLTIINLINTISEQKVVITLDQNSNQNIQEILLLHKYDIMLLNIFEAITFNFKEIEISDLGVNEQLVNMQNELNNINNLTTSEFMNVISQTIFMIEQTQLNKQQQKQITKLFEILSDYFVTIMKQKQYSDEDSCVLQNHFSLLLYVQTQQTQIQDIQEKILLENVIDQKIIQNVLQKQIQKRVSFKQYIDQKQQTTMNDNESYILEDDQILKILDMVFENQFTNKETHNMKQMTINLINELFNQNDYLSSDTLTDEKQYMDYKNFGVYLEIFSKYGQKFPQIQIFDANEEVEQLLNKVSSLMQLLKQNSNLKEADQIDKSKIKSKKEVGKQLEKNINPQKDINSIELNKQIGILLNILLNTNIHYYIQNLLVLVHEYLTYNIQNTSQQVINQYIQEESLIKFNLNIQQITDFVVGTQEMYNMIMEINYILSDYYKTSQSLIQLPQKLSSNVLIFKYIQSFLQYDIKNTQSKQKVIKQQIQSNQQKSNNILFMNNHFLQYFTTQIIQNSLYSDKQQLNYLFQIFDELERIIDKKQNNYLIRVKINCMYNMAQFQQDYNKVFKDYIQQCINNGSITQMTLSQLFELLYIFKQTSYQYKLFAPKSIIQQIIIQMFSSQVSNLITGESIQINQQNIEGFLIQQMIELYNICNQYIISINQNIQLDDQQYNTNFQIQLQGNQCIENDEEFYNELIQLLNMYYINNYQGIDITKSKIFIQTQIALLQVIDKQIQKSQSFSQAQKCLINNLFYLGIKQLIICNENVSENKQYIYDISQHLKNILTNQQINGDLCAKFKIKLNGQYLELNSIQLFNNNLSKLPLLFKSQFVSYCCNKLGILFENIQITDITYINIINITNERNSVQQTAIIQYYRTNLFISLIRSSFCIFQTLIHLFSLSTYLTAYYANQSNYLENPNQILYLQTLTDVGDNKQQFQAAFCELTNKIKELQQQVQIFQHCVSLLIKMKQNQQIFRQGLLSRTIQYCFSYIVNSPFCLIEVCKVLNNSQIVNQFVDTFYLCYDQLGILMQSHSFQTRSSEYNILINEVKFAKYLFEEQVKQLQEIKLPMFIKQDKVFQDKFEQQIYNISTYYNNSLQIKEQQTTYNSIQFNTLDLYKQDQIMYTNERIEDNQKDSFLMNELEGIWFSQFYISIEFAIGYMQIISLFNGGQNNQQEEKYRKSQNQMNTLAQQALNNQNSSLAVYRSRKRLSFEEYINTQLKKDNKNLTCKLSPFQVKMENCTNQLILFLFEVQNYSVWLSQKKPQNMQNAEFQERTKNQVKEFNTRLLQIQQYLSHDNLDSLQSETLVIMEMPFVEIWEYLHFLNFMNNNKNNKSQTSNLIQQLLILSRIYKQKLNVTNKNQLQLDLENLRIILRVVMLNSDLASHMYINICNNVFNSQTQATEQKQTILQCTYNGSIHNYYENNVEIIQFQKSIISLQQLPLLSQYTMRNQLSKIGTKSLLNNRIFAFDNYTLIMLADSYQTKPYSSEVTRLGYIQQIKSQFSNSKERGQVKKWGYQMLHFMPAISPQLHLGFNMCADTCGIENINLIEKLYYQGSPHSEIETYVQYQTSQLVNRQSQAKEKPTRNKDIKSMFDIITNALIILKNTENDINLYIDISKLVCCDLINKQNEAGLKHLVQDHMIEQGSLGAIFYEGYLLLIICYQQLYLLIGKTFTQKPIESIKQDIESIKQHINEAEKNIQKADTNAKKIQMDIKEIDNNYRQLVVNQDNLTRSNTHNTNDAVQNQIDNDIKNYKKKNEELSKDLQQNVKEIDSNNQKKQTLLQQFVIKINNALTSQTSSKQHVQLAEYCQNFMEVFRCFDKYYRFDTEQQHMLNHTLLNEKTSQKLLCQLYADINEQEAVFGLIYPFQVKTIQNKQFACCAYGASKKLFELNNYQCDKQFKFEQLQNKCHDSFAKYNLSFDYQQTIKEKQLDENRLCFFKNRPSFYFLGIQGDAMNYILNQCFLKAQPQPEYYPILFHQMCGLYQDSLSKMQRNEIQLQQIQQQRDPNYQCQEINASLNDTLKKFIKKQVQALLKQSNRNDQVYNKYVQILKYTPLFESGASVDPAEQKHNKDSDKLDQFKSQVINLERDYFQSLMFEKMIIYLLETQQYREIDYLSKDMRDEYIKKQYKESNITSFRQQISKFKLFMDKMTKKIKDLNNKVDESKVCQQDMIDWLNKFIQQIDVQQLQEDIRNEDQVVPHQMNSQFICQIIALINSIFPGQFQELHNIFIPGGAVYSSIFNSILENEESKQDDDKLRQMYMKLYNSPQVDFELEYDYRLSRKIYESYAIITALYPKLGIESILKQGILRRRCGESVYYEKYPNANDEKSTLNSSYKTLNNCNKLNCGDISYFSPLILFQIQQYTPSSIAPGINVVFFEKQESQTKDYEMINFDTYQRDNFEMATFIVQQVNMLIGQDSAFKFHQVSSNQQNQQQTTNSIIENSYQSDAAMTQYQVDTIVNIIQFSFLNPVENDKLIQKLILLLRDGILTSYHRKSLFTYQLIYYQYQLLFDIYQVQKQIYLLIREQINYIIDINVLYEQIKKIIMKQLMQFQQNHLELQLSQRQLSQMTQIKLILICAIQSFCCPPFNYLIFNTSTFSNLGSQQINLEQSQLSNSQNHQSLTNCEKLWSLLKSYLITIRLQSINDLMKHSMFLKGDPIAAQKLGDDCSIKQWGEDYQQILPLRDRLLLFLQSSIMQGNIDAAITQINTIEQGNKILKLDWEVTLAKIIIQQITVDIGIGKANSINYQHMFGKQIKKMTSNSFMILSSIIEEQLNQFGVQNQSKLLLTNQKFDNTQQYAEQINYFKQMFILLQNYFDTLFCSLNKNNPSSQIMFKQLLEQIILPSQLLLQYIPIQYKELMKFISQYKENCKQYTTFIDLISDDFILKCDKIHIQLIECNLQWIVIELTQNRVNTNPNVKAILMRLLVRYLTTQHNNVTKKEETLFHINYQIGNKKQLSLHKIQQLKKEQLHDIIEFTNGDPNKQLADIFFEELKTEAFDNYQIIYQIALKINQKFKDDYKSVDQQFLNKLYGLLVIVLTTQTQNQDSVEQLDSNLVNLFKLQQSEINQQIIWLIACSRQLQVLLAIKQQSISKQNINEYLHLLSSTVQQINSETKQTQEISQLDNLQKQSLQKLQFELNQLLQALPCSQIQTIKFQLSINHSKNNENSQLETQSVVPQLSKLLEKKIDFQQKQFYYQNINQLVFIDNLPFLQLQYQSDDLVNNFNNILLFNNYIQNNDLQILINLTFGLNKTLNQLITTNNIYNKTQQIFNISNSNQYEQSEYCQQIILSDSALLKYFPNTKNLRLTQLIDLNYQYENNTNVFNYDFEQVFQNRKQLSIQIAIQMLTAEIFNTIPTLPENVIQNYFYKKTVDVQSNTFVNAITGFQIPILKEQLQQSMLHQLHNAVELAHQSTPGRDHVNNSQQQCYQVIDKYTLEYLQFHNAIGYIGTALGKILIRLGLENTTKLGDFTKSVMCFDQSQINCGSILHDVNKQVYYQIIDIYQQQLLLNQQQDYQDILLAKAKDVLNSASTTLTKILEIISDKTDEKRYIRFYGVHFLPIQSFVKSQAQMPFCIEWVVHAISSFYE